MKKATQRRRDAETQSGEVFGFPVRVVDLGRADAGMMVSKTPEGLRLVGLNGGATVIPWNDIHRMAAESFTIK